MKERFKEAFRDYPFLTVGAIPFIPVLLAFFLWGLIVSPIETLVISGIIVSIFSITCFCYLMIETDIFS